ncbi:hypothetical protein T265_10331 [Opisthorchis viverrini]|uniref:Reverse transcriptase domain-containing protein n=1 Tax=Opisthorchis viverrini TaxID=6198 RepID=A0A074Z2P1_OPIVI|nr:hypothetical protein T265_10331 [Opisthorchis viverrini]KER21331.1 hypothetical protein T265_10331 [Opisthorchis viverrini]
MSTRSLSMIDDRNATPAGNEYDGARKSLKRQIVKSLRKDRELWWTSKAREMEKAFATGNSRALYQLIRSTGPRKATVSETINEKDGSLIHSQKRRLERWAEHFEEQFSWPPATQPVEIMHTGEWNVNLDRPSEEEIGYEIAVLKREKAPGPDGLYPALFKEGGKSLVTHLTKLIGAIWDEEKVPAEWGMSTVIPIFKKANTGQSSKSSAQVVAGWSLVGLEYADDMALIAEDQSEAQALLNKLNTIIIIMLQNVPSANISLTVQGEPLEIVENFTYLGSCISSDGSVSDEVSARTPKARITFANLRHLWRQKGISLDLKGRVYQATVRAVLLYGSETWPLLADDVKRLRFFDHRCLKSLAGFGWRQRVSNEMIRNQNAFYRELSGLIRQTERTDTVILVGGVSAQVGRLSSLESHLGGRFGVDARRTDSGDRPLQLCADRELFLASEWNVNIDRLSEEEIELKREKAPGPDGLYPALFKEGGESLAIHLTKFTGAIWNGEVSTEWGMSTVIPIFKKSGRENCVKTTLASAC